MSGTIAKPETKTGGMLRDPIAAMRDEFDNLLSRFWPEGEFALTRGGVPMMDMAETDSAVEMKLDLPGMKPEEIHVEVRNNELVVSGERKEEKVEKENGKHLHRTERRWGRFQRSVALPCPVVAENIEATYSNGVLALKLPKAEPTVTRTVKVKAI